MSNKILLFKEKFLENGFQAFIHNEEMKQCPLCNFEYIRYAFPIITFITIVH